MNTPTPDPLKKFSDELHALAARFQDHQVTLQEIIDALGARASALLIIILALPFCAPIAIPGLSTPFGLAILALAGCFALGRPPWLPQPCLSPSSGAALAALSEIYASCRREIERKQQENP